jgi:DNA-binding transcriptional LysR family regulator
VSRNLDPALLRAFVAVAETAGMTSAANILNLTQAAVSQQIKRLEEAFGTQLFERDRKGLRLTPAGERLLGKAKRMLALNDEIFAEMTAPQYSGHVRLGIPYDIVDAYLPPILKSFSQAHPLVQISIVSRPSVKLLEALAAREIDLTLTTELTCGPDGERLVAERLVWIGAKGGGAHLRRPLPLSFGSETCAFRPPVIEALGTAEIDWRFVSEMDANSTTVRTDLAVTMQLAATVPPDFDVLDMDAGLPPLPAFSINLYLPKASASPTAVELARHIRDSFLGRQRQAA